MLLLIHTEVSEAVEEARSPGFNAASIYYTYNERGEQKPCGFPTELADIIIRVLDAAEGLGIDMEAALKLKMEYNVTRPFRHGGKLA